MGTREELELENARLRSSLEAARGALKFCQSELEAWSKSAFGEGYKHIKLARERLAAALGKMGEEQ